MEKMIEETLNILQTCHKEIFASLQGLPAEALDWSPGPGMNSITVLVFHLTGSERYWIGDVAMGEFSGRNREAEFAARGAETEALRARLDDSLAYARQALGRISPQQLEQERMAPSDGRKVTAAWAVLHALEHACVHLGHIQLTRQLWEQSRFNG
jgi:uncharacterized damage-inducible protein DinB